MFGRPHPGDAGVSGAVTQWSLEILDPAAIGVPARPPRRHLGVMRSTTPGASRRLYRAVGADWQWTDRAAWGPERWEAWEQRVETWVAVADGREAGYVELDVAHASAGSVEIAYFGLLGPFHGLGLGGHLLVHGMRRALRLAPRAWVTTCSLDGPHALANYRARGFELFRTDLVLR